LFFKRKWAQSIPTWKQSACDADLNKLLRFNVGNVNSRIIRADIAGQCQRWPIKLNYFTLLKTGLVVALLATAPAANATTTGAATGITQTSATLNGSFTGNPFPRNFGMLPGSGCAVPPGGSSCSVSGLICGTNYQFVANDSAGSDPFNTFFTTLPCGGSSGGRSAPLLNGWWKR
jgi:hypothetical protein